MISKDVKVRVELADALSRPSRLLMVKHAQYSYGVDAQVATRLDVSPKDLPRPGTHFGTAGNGRVAAAYVIFLGVPDLDHFTYRDIREFGRRAVSVASMESPGVREICITLHGPGFGLDEEEAFKSEVAGIVDAVTKGPVSTNLEVVTFLEVDPRRFQRMERLLAVLLPDQGVSPGSLIRHRSPGVDRLGTVGYDSGERSHALVAMPFDHSFDDIFHYGIAPSIRAAGLLCERMDEQAFTGDVVHRLKERIRSAKCVVADVSGANPNVYLEVGFAWGCNVPAILVCKEASELKFDIRGQRCILYGSIRDLETKLSREIKAIAL
jgi:hypothetical protein